MIGITNVMNPKRKYIINEHAIFMFTDDLEDKIDNFEWVTSNVDVSTSN